VIVEVEGVTRRLTGKQHDSSHHIRRLLFFSVLTARQGKTAVRVQRRQSGRAGMRLQSPLFDATAGLCTPCDVCKAPNHGCILGIHNTRLRVGDGRCDGRRGAGVKSPIARDWCLVGHGVPWEAVAGAVVRWGKLVV